MQITWLPPNGRPSDGGYSWSRRVVVCLLILKCMHVAPLAMNQIMYIDSNFHTLIIISQLNEQIKYYFYENY